MHVVVRAAMEAGSAAGRHRSGSPPSRTSGWHAVVVEHLQLDPLEPQLTEAEVDERIECIGPVALAEIATVADGDANHPAAVDLVDAVQEDRADASLVPSRQMV